MDTKKISGNSPNAIDALSTSRTDRADKTRNDKANTANIAAPTSENYDVNLSPKARELMQARRKATELARNTPDIREDRVAELKARIQSGEYKVDAGKIADGMLQEAIKDEVAGRMHEEAKSR